MREDRIHFILSSTGLIWLLLIRFVGNYGLLTPFPGANVISVGSFVTTISAFTEPGCKDASKDPHASLGKEFQLELPGWCSTKKAGAIFFWFAFCKCLPLGMQDSSGA